MICHPTLTTNMDVRYTSTEAENDYLRKMELFAGFDVCLRDGFQSPGSRSATAGSLSEQRMTTSQVTWDAGIAQKSGKYTYSFTAKLTYVEDPFVIVRREDRYVATINRDTERTSLGISAGRYEYRNVATQHLEHTRYALTGTISHESSPTSKIIYDLSIGRYEDNVLDQYTALYTRGAPV